MAYEGMIAETITIRGNDTESISAYVARPLGAGPFPGMVLIHHAPGWDEWYREATRKFAHHGYAAISHNLYHRAGEGKADDVAAKVRAEGGVPSPGSMARSGSSVPARAGARHSCLPARPRALMPQQTSGADAS